MPQHATRGHGYKPYRQTTFKTVAAEMNEEAVKAAVRLEAARRGILLWRNNVGQLKNERGQVVRYGLCNDSKGLNKEIKSGDLIGIYPLTITPGHVGKTIGQFISVETKHSDWN